MEGGLTNKKNTVALIFRFTTLLPIPTDSEEISTADCDSISSTFCVTNSVKSYLGVAAVRGPDTLCFLPEGREKKLEKDSEHAWFLFSALPND